MSTNTKYHRKYSELVTPVGMAGFCNLAKASQFGSFEISLFLEDNAETAAFLEQVDAIHAANLEHENSTNSNATGVDRDLNYSMVTSAGDYPEGVAEGTKLIRFTFRSKKQPMIISSTGHDITEKLSKELPRGLPIQVDVLFSSYTVSGVSGTSMYPKTVTIQENKEENTNQ